MKVACRYCRAEIDLDHAVTVSAPIPGDTAKITTPYCNLAHMMRDHADTLTGYGVRYLIASQPTTKGE